MKSHAHAETNGFAGQMLGATLPDLIQMQCLTMATRAVRVDANSVTGRIYFAGGQIIHASVGMLAGESALFEMLGWKNGTFTCEEGVRAPDETVDRHWQSILLEAAQREDEQSETGAGEPKPHYPAVVPLPNTPMTKHPIEELRPDPEVVSFVQSDSEGTLLDSKGDDAENLQAGFAYVCGLLQLVGSSFGLENLREIQLSGKNQKVLCLLSETVTTVVVTTPKTNLNALVKQLS
jgi:predicted regulator of Ras-like GTPase activity (Roadblock/LC7/MglB family)